MAVFKHYPVPRARDREPSDNCWQKSKPTGGYYSKGRKHGTTTWVAMHGGNDVKPSEPGKIGENVYPVRRGKVVATGNVWGRAYGKQVLVKHRFWWKTRYITRYSFYAHLHRVTVSAGQRVYTQTKLGDLGDTGTGTAPHLHFAWQSTPNHKDGVIDPHGHLEAVR